MAECLHWYYKTTVRVPLLVFLFYFIFKFYYFTWNTKRLQFYLRDASSLLSASAELLVLLADVLYSRGIIQHSLEVTSDSLVNMVASLCLLYQIWLLCIKQFKHVGQTKIDAIWPINTFSYPWWVIMPIFYIFVDQCEPSRVHRTLQMTTVPLTAVY